MHTSRNPLIPIPLTALRILPLALIFAAGPTGTATATEDGKDWPVVCTVDNATIAAPRRSAKMDLEAAGETWLIRDGSYVVLSMPGCQVVDSGVRVRSAEPTEIIVAPTRTFLHSPLLQGTDDSGQLLLSRDGVRLSLSADLAEQWRSFESLLNGVYTSKLATPPLLSANGTMIVWLTGDAETTGAEFHDPMTGETTKIDMEMPPRRSKLNRVQLIAVDASAHEIVLIQGVNTVLGFDFSGKVLWGPEEPRIYLREDNLRLVPGGWMAWKYSGDEEDPARLEWVTVWGSGKLTVDTNDQIGHAAIDPTGQLVAFSLYRYLENGDREGELVVARTVDSKVIHRESTLYVKALPPGMNVDYAYRAPDDTVAFLGSEYLAVTRLNKVRREVVVLRIPEQERER